MSDTPRTTGKQTAGAFDVRNIIGGLLGVYGVILVLMGLFADAESAKPDDVNSNLWAGLALLVASAVFIVWWRLRPISVPHTDDHGELERPPQD